MPTVGGFGAVAEGVVGGAATVGGFGVTGVGTAADAVSPRIFGGGGSAAPIAVWRGEAGGRIPSGSVGAGPCAVDGETGFDAFGAGVWGRAAIGAGVWVRGAIGAGVCAREIVFAFVRPGVVPAAIGAVGGGCVLPRGFAPAGAGTTGARGAPPITCDARATVAGGRRPTPGWIVVSIFGGDAAAGESPGSNRSRARSRSSSSPGGSLPPEPGFGSPTRDLNCRPTLANTAM